MTLSIVENHQTIIGLNQAALDEWIEYREEMKKPLTKLALKKTTNIMLRHPESQQQVMVDAAISNDWTGLHEVDYPKQNTTRQNSMEHDLSDTSWAN